MTDVQVSHHDINCELHTGEQCKCAYRESERRAYGRAKNDAQDSLDWLVQQARHVGQPHGGNRLRSAESDLSYALRGYPVQAGARAGDAVRTQASEEEINRLTHILLAAWTKAEPAHVITLYPTSFVTTFVDMARAVLADREQVSATED